MAKELAGDRSMSSCEMALDRGKEFGSDPSVAVLRAEAALPTDLFEKSDCMVQRESASPLNMKSDTLPDSSVALIAYLKL